MEPTETPIVPSLISEGLFTLCDDSDEGKEEEKEVCRDENQLYLNYRGCVLDKNADLGGKKKEYASLDGLKLDESLESFKQTIINLRSCLKSSSKIEESKSLTCTTTIFSLPYFFYPSIIKGIHIPSKSTTIEISTIAANRNDYEYMKDLRKDVGQGKSITFETFNGDILTIHKNMVNVFKHEFEDEEETDDNKFAFLSEEARVGADYIDYNDKGALLKRQREILKKIDDHKKSKEAAFAPFSVLGSGLKNWFIILCQGGKFCIAKIQGDQIIEHKSDSKYVQRKKAGKRQINFDKTSSCMTSVGSQMRRNNERLHQEHIEETLKFYKEDLDSSDLILLHAPGVNKLFFIGPDKPLREIRAKVRTLNLQVTTANYTELKKVFDKVIELKICFNED
ncbi:unnamed protein product [Moneuplotes crassus]|uniref:VLRF1 domain-containing protein n=1 Tax=Euplotes crassus TaxID=5936 RepID=A0AAD1UH04_EUPCR|nr:unnamed protein product [Moneuplotes crassus]